MKSIVLCFTVFLLKFVVFSDDSCDPSKCPSVPKHYEEFGCVPVIEKDQCCPSYFDCSSLTERDSSKCYYGEEVFDIGTELHNQDIESSCTIGCRCRKFLDKSKFHCTHIDCPEFLSSSPDPPGKKCIRQYEQKGCCMKNKVCGEDLNQLAKCEFDGQIYYEGERLDTGDSCYSCICQKDFENKPVQENPACQKINCNMQLHYQDKINRGCIPVYYKSDECCPIYWRCPDDETTVISDPTRKAKSSDPKCTFGDLSMNIGDYLSPENDYDQCTVCSCKIPPFAHCIKTC